MPGGMGSGDGCGVIGCSGSGISGGVAGLAGTLANEKSGELLDKGHSAETPTESVARPSRSMQVLATLWATQKVCMAWEAAPHQNKMN